MIFFGAYDSNFYETMSQNDRIYYSAGLMNILMNLSQMDNPAKFIYLSYEKVFSKSTEQLYTEMDIPTSNGPKAFAVRQGEDVVRKNFKSDTLDTCVLRLDHVYGRPEGYSDIMEPFISMCDQALKYGTITTNSKKMYSMLYVEDAVEFIYSVITKDKTQYDMYNISSNILMSETEVAQILAQGVKGNVEVKEIEKGENYQIALSGDRFFKEFDGKIFDNPKKNIASIAGRICSRPKDYYEKEKTGGVTKNRFMAKFMELLRILVPYIEATVAFIPFFMLNNRATGSEYFGYLDFYLLYVLLFSIIFGQQQAVYTGILATAGFIFRQQYTRSLFEVILDYNTYVWIAQIFILGLVVGYLKDKLIMVREEDRREIEYYKSQADDIKRINSTNVDIKNVLETQIINQDDSLGKVYNITASLDQYEPEDVLFYAAEVVSELMNSKDVAIYSVANGDYARLFAATSDIARQLGNSIKYTDMEELYSTIKDDRVYINRDMDGVMPHMANAIFSDGKMRLIIMIWGIPWDSMNLSQANTLRVTGFLIQKAVINANKYMEALEDQRYREGTPILEMEAFTSLLRAYLNAIDKNLTEACVLNIDVGDKTQDEVSKELNSVLRTSDYLGRLKDGKLYVLLANTNLGNAEFVINRFQEMGYKAAIQEDISI